MKKSLIAIIVLTMVIIAAMTGCSNNKTTEATKVDYDWKEYVELGEYKDLPFYTEEFTVTDEEVDEQIETILLYATEIETIMEGVVEDGDTINIAFVGKIDGEEFEGGSSQSYDLTVGETSMIDGFVEGLIGKNVGESVTLNLRFPDDYHSTELQGKDVVFDITINSKRESITPELTDEFVKEYYDMNTVEELREHIKEDLLKDKESSVTSSIKSNLWNIILESTNIKSYPASEEEAARAQVETIEQEYRSTAESYGMEWADFLSGLMGTTEEGFQEMMDEQLDSIIKSNLITKAIADQEGIDLSDKAYKDRLLEILEANNLTEDTFQTYYNMTIYEYADQNGWREGILQDMVMDKVLELGKEVSKEEYQQYISEKLYDGEEVHMHEDGTIHGGTHEEEVAEADHDHDHDHEGEAEGTETAEGTEATEETEANEETDTEESEG